MFPIPNVFLTICFSPYTKSGEEFARTSGALLNFLLTSDGLRLVQALKRLFLLIEDFIDRDFFFHVS